jgi:hypothetical protein
MVDGAVQVSYQGNSQFSSAVNTALASRPVVFTLFSTGVGPSSDKTFQVYREGAGVPGVGTFPVGVGLPATSAFNAVYTRVGATGETLEGYAASSGELVITVSRPERLEGNFRFTGFRYCSRTGNGSEAACVVPRVPPAGAAAVRVSGSFVAVPYRSTTSNTR